MNRITMKQLVKLLAMDVDGTVTEESLERFLLNPGPATTTYSVSVDYGRSFRQMVAAGKYDGYDADPRHFPINGTGVVSVNLQLVHLDRWASTEDVLYRIKEDGSRPAMTEELLMFGAQHPEVQLKFKIVCLGPSSKYGSDRRVLCLASGARYRNLYWEWSACLWQPGTRFLVVKERK